jgi:putative methyltransferase (TIGR04325 family)
MTLFGTSDERMPTTKNILESLTPPIVWQRVRRILSGIRGGQIRFVGNFRSWAEAQAASTSNGYSTELILDRTIEAIRRVKNGEAAFERDSVTFQELEYHFPLAWALMRAAARHGRLHVLDFGGALGSTYSQSRPLLDSTPSLKWAIVEQLGHVEAGKKEFTNQELSFHRTVEEACRYQQCDVLLLSGVLQCLPDPLGFLDSVLNLGIPSVILDRTPFMLNGIPRLTVQHVPDWIYPASYPAWFLSGHEVMAKFAKRYDKIASWPALDKHHPEGGSAEYKGFLFEMKKN